MTNVGSLRPSHTERDSVNSVVVDPEPQTKHEKMMVAANVALSPSGTATLARETTLMPSILGLPYLMCLLFAPSAEMRWGSCVSIVCPLCRNEVGFLCVYCLPRLPK